MRIRVLAFDANEYIKDLEETIQNLGDARNDLNESRQRSSRYYVKPMLRVKKDQGRVDYWQKRLNKMQQETKGSCTLRILLAASEEEVEDLIDTVPKWAAKQNEDLHDRFVDQVFKHAPELVLPTVRYAVEHLKLLPQGSTRAREIYNRALIKLEKL